jgi:hypothetical protein
MARSRHVPLVCLTAQQWKLLSAGQRIEIADVMIDDAARRIEIELGHEAIAARRPPDPPQAREFLPPRRKAQ